VKPWSAIKVAIARKHNARVRPGPDDNLAAMRQVWVAFLFVSAFACARSEPAAPAAAPAAAQAPATSAVQAPPTSASPASAPAQLPAQSPAATQSAPLAGEWPAIDLRACGITLRHPPSYFVATNRIGTTYLREVDLLDATPELREPLAGGGPPGQRPRLINFTSHAVTGYAGADEPLDPIQWLRTRKGPKVAASAIRRVTVAGLPALFYRASGGATAVDGVVWSCPGRVIEAKVYFHGPNDRLRQEFSRILTMLRVRGAAVTSAVSCAPPGLPCSSPQLSLCVEGRWTCTALNREPPRSLRAVPVR
jgi:hypothetical protein